MSVICQTFVQNAWRSDLCSNCFKCREEHDASASCRSSSAHRYMPQATSLYQSRGISTSLKWRLSEPIYERVARRDFGSQTLTKASFLAEPRTEERRGRGILVTTQHDKRRRSRSSVDFASEEALVIGYGGNDYDSDLSPWEMGSDDGSVDLDVLDDNDDDRKITRMTRNNTEFNSSNRNLTLPPEKESSKDENKRNSINNNNKMSPLKTPDRTLDIITYNDIQKKQPEKKLNQYYFPSSTEQHSFLHSKVVNVNEKTSNHPLENIKVENCKREENSKNLLKDENSRNLLKDEFTPLNTKTYSFVSELNKSVILSSEHSSDSDYSTCRLTAGDSTDSESFQDAEESRILPCSSFLHGSFPPQQKVLLQQSLSSLESDKKYDAGSSTSGDVSNLSDDSDASERTTSYKSRNVRVPKNSPTDTKRPGKEVTFSDKHSTVEKNSILTNTNKPEIKDIPSEIAKKTVPCKQKPVETASNEKVQISENNISQNAQNHKNSETISISVDSKYNSKTHDNKTTNSPAPNPPVDINLRNIIAINGCSTNPKENATPNGHPIVTKTKSSPPRVAKSPEKQEVVRSKSLESVSDKENKSHSHIIPEPKPYVDEYFFKDPSDDDDYEKSPEAINNRQSKLAALALELELARRDSAMKSNNAKAPQPSLPSVPPPETKLPPPQNEEIYPTIKKGSAISCTSRLNILPDVLQETPTKTKKSRFSLKKLLKRNKDSGTFSPATKESNPKAWKKQTFDRSRLSLEIVHPMDLMESTLTEEGYAVSCHPGKSSIFKGGYSNRARSLSALPQVEFQEQSNCSLLECRRTDTLPAVRKAGTVAERKKNRPSLVRTPSCSAISNRPSPQHTTAPDQRTPPPKPPPPPKYKVAHPPPPPPPPHYHLRAKAPATPQRPPPPKIPEGKCRTPSGDSSKQDSDKEYANLGDIRSLLTPVKPQRPSALSAPHVREGSEAEQPYDTLQPQQQHEEDHYTYLDDTEVRGSPRKSSSCGSVVSSSSSFSQLQQGDRGRRPWLDLQTSYAAIAATNYESLTEIIATTLNESAEYFRNAGKSLKWKDFALEADAPQVVLHNKCVYNAIHKMQEREKIMLMVSPRKQCAPPSPRTHPRFPVLTTFCDHITTATTSAQWSTVHVLRRSRMLTVSQFAQEATRDTGNQHVHLRDHCFLLLQVIHALKGLQAEGVEEVDCDLLRRLSVAVAKEDTPPVFVLLPEDKAALCEEGGGRRTLCQATLDTLLHLLQVGTAEDLSSCKVNGDSLLEPVAHTFRAIAKALAEEKASSLSQAKGLLEYMLWGPVDLRESDPPADDTVLQRWLDLQRAQMVKSTITQLQNNSTLHVYEEYQLVFLLQASVKSLKSVISKL